MHGVDDGFDQNKYILGTETIRFNFSLTLSNFPIEIKIGTEGTSANKLGLAKNSTLLNRLSSAGLIHSKTWAYYQGWTGAETRHQLDGSLVFEGYDEVKKIGQNTTISFSNDDQCVSGLLVTIHDIKMNFLHGTNQSIFGSFAGSAMDACLVPNIPLLDLPVGLWNSFVKLSGVNVLGRSVGINAWGMLISGNKSLVFFYLTTGLVL